MHTHTHTHTHTHARARAIFLTAPNIAHTRIHFEAAHSRVNTKRSALPTCRGFTTQTRPSLFRHSMFQIIWQRCNFPVSSSNYIPSVNPSSPCRSFSCMSFTFRTNSNAFTFTAVFKEMLKVNFFRLQCCICIFCWGSFLLSAHALSRPSIPSLLIQFQFYHDTDTI
jgi:hypothetical protein